MLLNKRDLRKEKNKQAIKEAALEIAAKEGWQGVTIRKIADQILYSAPIVYEHFKNKDDLYRQLVIDGFHELSSKTFEAMEKENTPEEKILKLADIRFDFAVQNPTLHHMMFDADNPGWQKMELIKAMEKLKEYVFGIFNEIAGKPDRTPEYFLNMICLVKGYTYFMNKMDLAKKMNTNFFGQTADMKELFINSIKRFLEGIKSDQ